MILPKALSLPPWNGQSFQWHMIGLMHTCHLSVVGGGGVDGVVVVLIVVVELIFFIYVTRAGG
jgi:hypothetical protein